MRTIKEVERYAVVTLYKTCAAAYNLPPTARLLTLKVMTDPTKILVRRPDGQASVVQAIHIANSLTILPSSKYYKEALNKTDKALTKEYKLNPEFAAMVDSLQPKVQPVAIQTEQPAQPVATPSDSTILAQILTTLQSIDRKLDSLCNKK